MVSDGILFYVSGWLITLEEFDRDDFNISLVKEVVDELKIDQLNRTTG